MSHKKDDDDDDDSSNEQDASPNDVTSSHYQTHTANSYEDSFFYSSQSKYVQDLAQQVARRLGLQQNDCEEEKDANRTEGSEPSILLDVGGGTGNFTQRVMELSAKQPPWSAIVMDPFLSPREVHSDGVDKKIHFLPKSAQKVFAGNEEGSNNNKPSTRKDDLIFHKVLMKEVIHHIEPSELRVAVFQGIRQRLVHAVPSRNPSDERNVAIVPSLLIITRPDRNLDYPLWKQAEDVWAQYQPSTELLRHELQTAGFDRIHVEYLDYPCRIPLQTWQTMIQQRFWSTFSYFTNSQLRDACQELPRLHANRLDADDNLHFNDRLVVLTAHHDRCDDVDDNEEKDSVEGSIF